MKTKIFAGFIVLLVVAVFVGNHILGNKIANEIDVQLKTNIEKNELPVSIDYTEVKVDPLFTSVKLVGVSIAAPEEAGTFKSKEIEIDIPYKEALRLAGSTEFEELKSFAIKFVNPEFVGLELELMVKLDELTIDFDGHLTKENLENLQNKFPDEKQELTFSFSGLKIDLPEEYAKIPLLSELQKQFSELDKGSYTLAYLPEKKEVNIKEFSITSPIISYNGNSSLSYKGSGFNDFKPQNAHVQSELILKPDNFEWEDENGKGEFSLGKLAFKTNMHVNLDNKTLPEGEMSIDVQKLKINYGDENQNSGGGSPLNMTFNNVDMEKLEFHYKLEDEVLSITDTEIKSSILDAIIFANVQIDPSNPVNSTITDAKIEVGKMSSDLETMIAGFEQQMGKELPRTNGKIILELSGKIASPKIKGFEY